jgi:hypothetical protein
LIVAFLWTPTRFDKNRGRTKAGLGVITNIINGCIECGPRATAEGRANPANRVLCFNAIASVMGVTVPTGWADDCADQKNFQQCPSYLDPTRRCDAGRTDANAGCGMCCVGNSDCPGDERCFSSLDTKSCPD